MIKNDMENGLFRSCDVKNLSGGIYWLFKKGIGVWDWRLGRGEIQSNQDPKGKDIEQQQQKKSKAKKKKWWKKERSRVILIPIFGWLILNAKPSHDFIHP